MSEEIAKLVAEAEKLLEGVTPGEWTLGMPGRDDAHMCRILSDYDPQAKDRAEFVRDKVRCVIGETWDPKHVVSYVGLTRQECVANAALFAASKRIIRALLDTLLSVRERGEK